MAKQCAIITWSLLYFVLFLQIFYLWKKDKAALKEIKDRDKELLIKVNKFIHTHELISEIFSWKWHSPDPFHPFFTSAGELLRDFHHRAWSWGGAVPQRGRQEVVEAAALPAEGLRNLLRAQREDQGQGSKQNIICGKGQTINKHTTPITRLLVVKMKIKQIKTFFICNVK